jgi:hypothetical protein
MKNLTCFLFWALCYLVLLPSPTLRAAHRGASDTVYIVVLRPGIDRPHLFSKSELEQLDVFNGVFKRSFQQQFQLLSGKQCSTYYQVIDHENAPENQRLRELFDVQGVFLRPHFDFRGEIQRETDGYRLYLSMVDMQQNTLLSSYQVTFAFSKADDTQLAAQKGIEAAQAMLNDLCGSKCQPNVVKAFYDTEKNQYYQDLVRLFRLLQSYSVSRDDVDELDEQIADLMAKNSMKQDEMFLSHSLIEGLFWKNVRNYPEKAEKYLKEAQEYYCHRTTSQQDLDLLKKVYHFTQFDEFIQTQIETCSR